MQKCAQKSNQTSFEGNTPPLPGRRIFDIPMHAFSPGGGDDAQRTNQRSIVQRCSRFSRSFVDRRDAAIAVASRTLPRDCTVLHSRRTHDHCDGVSKSGRESIFPIARHQAQFLFAASADALLNGELFLWISHVLYLQPMGTEDLFQFDWSFVDQIGNNPFHAMWFFFANGGWIIFLWLAGWIALQMWQSWRQNLYNAKKKFICLSIRVPHMHEQTPRAVENLFAYFAGAHSGNSWTDDWINGKTQDTISVEIVSIDGNVQFVVRTVRGFRDLVEAAVYSQYPDADISEIEDYAAAVPSHYPDEEWNLWGTQFVNGKPDFYPIRTYPSFEDKVSGEFKAPLAALLESLSRLGPGEQAWFQIVLLPIAQGDFSKKADGLVKKLTGQKVEAKKGFLDHLADIPVGVISDIASVAFSSGEHAPPKKEGPKEISKMMHMTQTEKDVVGAIENKASKMVFMCKMRFIYVAKKTVMSNARIVNPFMGSMRQFSLANLQVIKPDFKHVGVNGAMWFFKERRNNERRTHLIHAYKARSMWAGMPGFHLCSEELATLWHFPVSGQVKSPQLRKTEIKKTEPPANIPFG